MDPDTKKSVAAWSSVIWSGILAATKMVVGIMTGSLGILSEALHSTLDLVAAGGTVYAVKVAAQPADKDHPYGHGKIENLMALGETLLLLCTAGWVIMEAVERLMSNDPNALAQARGKRNPQRRAGGRCSALHHRYLEQRRRASGYHWCRCG